MAEATPIHEYRCLICTEPYSDPRLLHCGHTFCYQCLSSYIDTENVTEDDRLYFPCPVCEAPILHDDVNADVSTWATCFPKNDSLATPTSQPSGVHLCAPCSRGQESIPADVMCTDCNEKLCGDCRIHHERSKASAWHHLVSMSGDVGLLPDVTVYESCHRHGGRPFEVYCVDHNAMGCSTCTLVTHRQCNNVKPMDEVIQKTTATPSPVETEWKELTDETKKLVDEDDVGMAVLNRKETELLTYMSNRIQKVKDKFDELKTISESEVTDTFKKYKEQLIFRRKCINAFHINAENSNKLLACQEQLSERHRFFLCEQTKTQISGHYRRMDQKTKKEPNRFDITLKLEAVIDEIMKMTTIGNVDVTSSVSPASQNASSRIDSLIGRLLSTPPATNFADSTSTSDLVGSLQCVAVETTDVTKTVDVWTGSVSCVHTVNVSTLGGVQRPWLTGGIFTDNNEILITDYSNSRLLLFDDKYSFQREYDVDGQPTDIERGRTIDEICVAVDGNSILRCTLQNGQLSVISRIGAPHDTWGIAVLGDKLLVGTPDSVKVMSIDGEITESIKKGGVHTYVTVSTPNSTVYHKDGDDVVCRRLASTSDAVVYRYSHRALWDPVGIGLDRDHNVYVCGNSSKNVYLISPDGSRGRVLLPKLSEITYPYGIVVHPNKQEFVVTSNSWAQSTALEVYRFCDND